VTVDGADEGLEGTAGQIIVEAAVGFERGADDYERARPSYPDAAIELIVAEAGLGPGTTVCDLAAGTGKLTRLLVPSGAEVIAVEPVAAMRAQLVRVVPGVEVLDGTAETIPLGDGSVDALTVAQAFHWFDTDRALPEIHRVLRPGGTLVLIWNVRDETVDWVKQFTELIVARSGGRPYTPYHQLRTGEAMTADHVEVVRASGRFGEVREALFPNPQVATVDDVVARAASTSFVAALDPEPRQALLDEVRDLVEHHPDTAGRDRFEFPHETMVSWCTSA
jgi:ubiquinone/menaquinone biosynthesis C-methylase UbiE